MRTRIRFLALFLSLSLAACGGGSPDPAGGNQGGGGGGAGGGGAGGGGGGGGGGSGGGGGTPILFTDDAADLGKAGAFPSDLVLDTAGTLFTVDDAMIPANVVSVPAALRVPITANDLVDMDGIRPARSVTTFGSGLFGAFTGDMELAFGRWLFVTVSAGNSVSSDGANVLRLANLVLVDRQTGVIVQTINLAWSLKREGSFSTAGVYTLIPQSLPVMCAFVPNPNGTQTGKVFVAMSNGAGSTAGLTNFFEGTIQEWRVDFTALLPITPETAGRGATDVTRTRVTAHHNPVGLTPYRAKSGVDYLILTAAGASLFDQNGVVHAVSDAFLEFLDLDTGIWRDNLAANLGEILPAAQRLALGEDAQETTFGVLTSQTRAAAYFVELEGLDSNPPDPARIGLMRTVAIVPGGATTDGSGFLPGVGLTASSRTAVLSSFFPATLHVLALPDDIAFGSIVVAPAPFDTADLQSEEAFGLGALAVATTPASAEVFVIVNGNFDSNFLPLRHGFVGTLTTGGRLP